MKRCLDSCVVSSSGRGRLLRASGLERRRNEVVRRSGLTASRRASFALASARNIIATAVSDLIERRVLELGEDVDERDSDGEQREVAECSQQLEVLIIEASIEVRLAEVGIAGNLSDFMQSVSEVEERVVAHQTQFDDDGKDEPHPGCSQMIGQASVPTNADEGEHPEAHDVESRSSSTTRAENEENCGECVDGVAQQEHPGRRRAGVSAAGCVSRIDGPHEE